MPRLVRKAPLLLLALPLWLIAQCLAQPDAPVAFSLPSLVINKQPQDSPASGREEGHKAKPDSRVVGLRAGAPATSVFDTLSLQLLDVVDSRCPAGAQCIWAGEVTASLAVVEDGTNPSIVTVSSNPPTPNVSTPLLGFVLELRDVKSYQPSPATDKGIDKLAPEFAKLAKLAKLAKPAFVVTVVATAPSPARMDLHRAKLRWAAATQGMEGYTMVQSRLCFCLEDARRPATLAVDAGDKLISGVYVDAPVTAVTSDFLGTTYKSVTQLFDTIQESFDQNAASIQVTYDAQLGYPASIYIDIDENMADEELSWSITALQIRRALA